MAGRHDVSLIFAIGPAGDLVSINDVPNGLACGCVCPHCHATARGDAVGIALVNAWVDRFNSGA